MSAYEIYARQSTVQIDITTLYRNLDALKQRGIVHHTHHSEGYILCRHQYECCDDHDLIICENCQHIQEVHIEKKTKKLLGLTTQRVEIYGQCQNC